MQMGRSPKLLHPGQSPGARFGAALRSHRLAGGLTLAELGRRVHVSADLLGKIELATRHPQPDLITRLDAALDAGGQLIRISPPPRSAHAKGEQKNLGAAAMSSSIAQMRAALMDYRQLLPCGADADQLTTLPTPDALRNEVGRLFADYQFSRFENVAIGLPSVLSMATSSARSADQAGFHGLLALSYQLAASIMAKVGETDLAWIAAERGIRSAEQAADPLVLGSLLRCTAYTLHAAGRFADGVRVTEHAANVLHPHLAARGEEMLSVYGTLFLTGAVAAARAQDRATASTFLREAQDCASRVGEDGNVLWTAFGPTNVALHRMTVAVELGDIQAALDLVDRIDASRLPAERRVRHAIESARAWAAAHKRDDALAALLAAEQFAPQQVRSHAISRQLVRSWLRDGRRHRHGELELLGARLGVS
jgi:transcriptional regulator with XRE-family HTH domain